MIWKEVWDKDLMSPLGGLTRNLCGDEVWILKAIGVVEERDLSLRLARHLEPRVKSISTSGSDTCMSFSIGVREERVVGWGGRGVGESVMKN